MPFCRILCGPVKVTDKPYFSCYYRATRTICFEDGEGVSLDGDDGDAGSKPDSGSVRRSGAC
jgi:hypothetical protein